MKPRIYTYKITFPDQGWWYWGVHKEKKFGEEYFGSPKSHSEKWNLYEYEKQILEFFDSYEEARRVEIRLIKPDLNNPCCLNESCGGHISDMYQSEGILEWWKNNPEAKKVVQQMGLKYGSANISALNAKLSPEERRTKAKLASSCADLKKRKENMKRIQAEHNPAKGTKWATDGIKNKRVRDGVLPKNYKWGYTSNACLNTVVNSIRFRCLVTGFESTAGPLSCFQKKRGIDTSLRERIE